MNLADLFNVTTLTAAVNKLPAMPGKVGAMGLFDEKGIATTTVTIDEQEGRLILVPNASRNVETRLTGRVAAAQITDMMKVPGSYSSLAGEKAEAAGPHQVRKTRVQLVQGRSAEELVGQELPIEGRTDQAEETLVHQRSPSWR